MEIWVELHSTQNFKLRFLIETSQRLFKILAVMKDLSIFCYMLSLQNPSPISSFKTKNL